MATKRNRKRGRLALVTAVLAGALIAAAIAFGAATPSPQLYAELHEPGGVGGWFWPANAALVVTADDPATPATPDYTLTLTTDDQGGFGHGPIPVRPGWVVTASDGETTKALTVRDVSITDVDLVTSVVRGTAVPGSRVDYVGCGGPASVSVLAGADGTWSADLSTVCSITDAGFANALLFGSDDSVFTVYTWFAPGTPDEALGNMVTHGWIPNEGVATSVVRQIENVPVKALTNHLNALVRSGVITQQTMNAILEVAAA